MKPEIRVGQEWEKADNNRQGATRVRVLEVRHNRLSVATVTEDGHLIRKRELLRSALTNTPSGYMLVKEAEVAT